MEPVILSSNDEKFLRQVTRFCHSIEKYMGLLELDAADVLQLQNDLGVMIYVMANPEAFTPDFIRFNLVALRTQFAALKKCCVNSRLYNEKAAADLGFESPAPTTRETSWTWHTWFTGMWKLEPNFS